VLLDALPQAKDCLQSGSPTSTSSMGNTRLWRMIGGVLKLHALPSVSFGLELQHFNFMILSYYLLIGKQWLPTSHRLLHILSMPT
jgi:hypothetical protein